MTTQVARSIMALEQTRATRRLQKWSLVRVNPSQTNCPRCGDRLRTNYDELLCIQCGYVDYAYVPTNQQNRERYSHTVMKPLSTTRLPSEGETQ